MTGFEELEIRIDKNNKWKIDFLKKGKIVYSTAIPPTSSDRIDFIDRKCVYHYNYNKPISHGILIKIKKGKAELFLIPLGKILRRHYF